MISFKQFITENTQAEVCVGLFERKSGYREETHSFLPMMVKIII
jgi:hypothetical protein